MIIEKFDIDDIVIGDRLRSVDDKRVEDLAQSISAIGLHTPITLRVVPTMVIDDREIDGVPLLIAGLHRLLAVKSLGLTEIDAVVEEGSEIDARMWEIAENLHRSELTVLERCEHIAEWVRLSIERDEAEEVFSQTEKKPPGGRPVGGVNKASRELGLDRNDAYRAVEIDRLAPEAKKEAKILRLDRNKTALLNAAKGISEEEQIRRLRKEAATRASSETNVSASEVRINRAVNAVQRLSHEELLIFDEWLAEYHRAQGGAVFDNTNAGAH